MVPYVVKEPGLIDDEENQQAHSSDGYHQLRVYVHDGSRDIVVASEDYHL